MPMPRGKLSLKKILLKTQDFLPKWKGKGGGKASELQLVTKAEQHPPYIIQCKRKVLTISLHLCEEHIRDVFVFLDSILIKSALCKDIFISDFHTDCQQWVISCRSVTAQVQKERKSN